MRMGASEEITRSPPAARQPPEGLLLGPIVWWLALSAYGAWRRRS